MEKPVVVLMLLLLRCEDAAALDPCPGVPDRYNRLCNHTECVSIADELLEMMDNTTDPCEDFYQYACGGWISRQFLKSQSDKVTTFPTNLPWEMIRKILSEEPKPADLPPMQKAKAFYVSCVKYKTDAEIPSEETIKALMKEPWYRDWLNNTNNTTPYTVVEAVTDVFGKWPLTCKNCSTDEFILETALIKAVTLGVHALFTIQADPESFTDSEKGKRPSNLYVGIPVLAFPIRLYESFSRYPSYRKVYAKKIVQDAKQFTVDDRDAALQDALDIVDVEIALAGMYNNLTTKGVKENRTLHDLDTNYGQVLNWTHFVTDLASTPGINITDITPQEVVIVSDPEYLRRMSEYFVQLPKRIQANYIIWRVIDSLNNVLMEDDRKLKNVLNAASRRYMPALMSELSCVTYTTEVFHPVLYRLLYDAPGGNIRIDMAKSIIDSLKNEFQKYFRNRAWIDLGTKNLISDKIGAIKLDLSFHEEVTNNTVLKSLYSNKTVDVSSFIRNVVQARKDAFVRDLKNIRRTKAVDPTSLPHQFLGQYYRTLNTLYITPGVLQYPFYSSADFWELTYAGFGSVMAREIMRGFDTVGYRYNKDGVEGDWWSPLEAQRYLRNAECMVTAYTNYTYTPGGLPVNANLTINSNMADFIGMKMAHQAYMQNRIRLGESAKMRLPGVPLTSTQAFFVKYAQLRCAVEGALSARDTLSAKHSPDKIRVNVALSYFSGFQYSFNCRHNSYMRTIYSCYDW